MAFSISNIKSKNPEKGFKYLFDTNIWLAVLYDFYFRDEYNCYISFFDNILNNKFTSDAKIAMPSILLTEILNRVMRDIFYYEYERQFPEIKNEQNPFKAYRKTAQYKIDLDVATAEIRSYHSKIEFTSDNLNKYTCKELIKNIPGHLDINDYIYTKIAAEQNIVIITNDADFSVEGIQIYTSRKSLLKL